MATSDHLQTALLTEHFRYTPLTLVDEIINLVNEVVFRAVNAVEEGLSNIPASDLGFQLTRPQHSTLSRPDQQSAALDDTKQTELDHGIVQLESLLNATIDRDFDKFEIYTLRNILCLGHEEEDLARWVRLDHYEGLDFEAAGRAPRPEDVQLQRRKLHETKKLNRMLQAEERRNAAVLAQVQEVLRDKFEFLNPGVGQQQGLKDNVGYALAQLPALRGLLAELKGSLVNLPAVRNGRDDEDSAEAVRARYLDSQARKALERHGMDAEAAAKTAAASVGRKVAAEELEGISAVVQALGGAEDRSSRPRRRSDDEHMES